MVAELLQIREVVNAESKQSDARKGKPNHSSIVTARHENTSMAQEAIMAGPAKECMEVKIQESRTHLYSHSKKLKPRETRYSATDRKALGTVLTCTQFHHFLWETKVIIR